jgi:hypothetical protein
MKELHRVILLLVKTRVIVVSRGNHPPLRDDKRFLPAWRAPPNNQHLLPASRASSVTTSVSFPLARRS